MGAIVANERYMLVSMRGIEQGAGFLQWSNWVLQRVVVTQLVTSTPRTNEVGRREAHVAHLHPMV